MEILFENPIVLIILIGIISSIFKNRNKSEKQDSPAKRAESRKPVQKSSDPFNEMKDLFKEVQRSFQEELNPAKKLKEDGPQKIDEVKLNYKEEQPEKSSMSKQVTETPHEHQVQKTKQASQLKVDESKLVDAVIWSEILGPPRAKKPYLQNRTRGKY